MRWNLEELHQAVRSYGDIHRAVFVRYSAALRGEISFQIATENYEKVGGQRNDATIRSKIELLISFYFHALTPGMKKFNDARRKMMQILREAEDAPTKGQDTSAYATPFWEAIDVLASEESSLCTDIARHAKQFVWGGRKRNALGLRSLGVHCPLRSFDLTKKIERELARIRL